MVEHNVEAGFRGWQRNKIAMVIAGADAPDSVKDFADHVCDGSNDELVINSALARMPSRGGRVVFIGSFAIAGSIVIPGAGNWLIEGDGAATQFTISAAAPLFSITGTGTVVFFMLVGLGGAVGTYGIYTASATAVYALGCVFSGFATAPALINGTTYGDAAIYGILPNVDAAAIRGRHLGEAFRDVFIAVPAEDDDLIVNAEDLTAATPIACTLAGQPDAPRTIKFTITDGDASISAYSITIVGIDAMGVTRTETFTFASGLTFETDYAYARVTSITVTSITGDNAGDILDVGTGSKLGLTRAISAAADVKVVIEDAVQLEPADYTVDATYNTVDVSTGGAIAGGEDYTIIYRPTAF